MIREEHSPQSSSGSLLSAPPRFVWPFLALIAAAALASGAFWLGRQAAGDFPAEGSAEAGFARDMAVHHAQAVEMAEIIRARTDDPEIQVLALDIALTQQAQIGQMQGWLDVWDLPPTATQPAMAWMGHPTRGPMPGMATTDELAQLRVLPAGKADMLFLRLMIAHHRAGIDMAQGVIDRSERPEVVRLANAIKDAQRAEVEQMEKMLQSRMTGG